MRQLRKDARVEGIVPNFFLGVPRRALRRMQETRSRNLSGARTRNGSVVRGGRNAFRTTVGHPLRRPFGNRPARIFPGGRVRNRNVRVLRHPLPRDSRRSPRSGNRRHLSAFSLPSGRKFALPAFRTRPLERRTPYPRMERPSLSRGDLYVFLFAVPYSRGGSLSKKRTLPRCGGGLGVLRHIALRGNVGRF